MEFCDTDDLTQQVILASMPDEMIFKHIENNEKETKEKTSKSHSYCQHLDLGYFELTSSEPPKKGTNAKSFSTNKDCQKGSSNNPSSALKKPSEAFNKNYAPNPQEKSFEMQTSPISYPTGTGYKQDNYPNSKPEPVPNYSSGFANPNLRSTQPLHQTPNTQQINPSGSQPRPGSAPAYQPNNSRPASIPTNYAQADPIPNTQPRPNPGPVNQANNSRPASIPPGNYEQFNRGPPPPQVVAQNNPNQPVNPPYYPAPYNQGNNSVPINPNPQYSQPVNPDYYQAPHHQQNPIQNNPHINYPPALTQAPQGYHIPGQYTSQNLSYYPPPPLGNSPQYLPDPNLQAYPVGYQGVIYTAYPSPCPYAQVSNQYYQPTRIKSVTVIPKH